MNLRKFKIGFEVRSLDPYGLLGKEDLEDRLENSDKFREACEEGLVTPGKYFSEYGLSLPAENCKLREEEFDYNSFDYRDYVEVIEVENPVLDNIFRSWEFEDKN